MSVSRRSVLKSAVVVGAAAATACSRPGENGGMTDVLFTPALSTVPIEGTNQHYAVRRIYCVGRNYAAHAREMGSDPTREPPFFFQKPRDAVQIVPRGVTIEHPYPPVTKNYHYEVELVAALGRGRQGRDRPSGRSIWSTAMPSAST